MKQFGTNFFT